MASTMILLGVAMRDHLATLLDDFRRHGRQIAVVRIRGNRRRVATYEEIARLAGRFAALLVQESIGPGDRVLLWAENSAEWIAAFYGCMLRGVLAVPLDATSTADFAARVASDVTPKLVVGDEALLRRMPDEWLCLSFEDWASILPTEESGPVAELSHQTPLEILFTSGTTGDPKGIVLTHGNVLASVEPIVAGAKPYLRYERLVHPLRFLHTLPLSHVFGQTMGLWIPPLFAAEVHFENHLVASRLLETIRRERISVLAAVPRVHALLRSHLEAAYPGLAEQVAAADSLKAWQRWVRFRQIHFALGLKFWALVSGGGALAPVVEQFWNVLGFVVIQGYGMTETTALITLNHPFHVARGSIGKPLPGREIRLSEDGEVLVRGAMISTATWSDGALQPRGEEWLATGDLVERQASGDLHFLGRKSEVIVTASGLNLYPEDMEAVLEQEPGVAACAVVAMETFTGPEPCAVMAFRGSAEQCARAVVHANTHLAEYQRLRRWALWPEPDLPRTPTGKVRRKVVAEWLAAVHQIAMTTVSKSSRAAIFHQRDWLLTLIMQITGETPAVIGDELRLTEDLRLDSLGRVQLAAAIEERLGIAAGSELLEQVQTLGELREALAAEPCQQAYFDAPQRVHFLLHSHFNFTNHGNPEGAPRGEGPAFHSPAEKMTAGDAHMETTDAAVRSTGYVYPHWPWWRLFCWKRAVFIEAILRPLIWFLAKPAVTSFFHLGSDEPMLIVANHVTAYDAPLIQYALPGSIRRRMAIAMSGEMLEDFRHFRNPQQGSVKDRFFVFGPIVYLLLTALFNVFPLPRQRDFQRSFAHAGEALDRGFHVLVFPEGTRSAEGSLAHFRPGIGLLAKQSAAPVLPVAICGLGDLKRHRRGWFRSGTIQIRIGQPIRFSATESEAAIVRRLQVEVEALLNG